MASSQRRYERLLALDGKEMPDSVEAGGASWRRVKVFKHDFFAATGLYEAADGRQGVLKIFRPHPYLILPVHWLSPFQARHEEKVYTALKDSRHVPKFHGRVGPTGIFHEFLPGRTLKECDAVKDGFFEELRELLKLMHSRGIAYVDTNKPDNILVGEDGSPFLIDFQITWVQPPSPWGLPFLPLFSIFKDMDFYHVLKHERKFHPERISKESIDSLRPWYLKLHRLVADPVRKIRRGWLRKVEAEASARPEGSERH